MQYARLKTIYFEFEKGTKTEFPVNIPHRHVLVAIFTPEIPQSAEIALNRLNLKPYEQAVNKYAGSDLTYDVLSIDSPGVRVIKGLDTVSEYTTNTNNKCPVIVTYLEFYES